MSLKSFLSCSTRFGSYQDTHMTRVLLLPFITTVWIPVVLAIFNII